MKASRFRGWGLNIILALVTAWGVHRAWIYFTATTPPSVETRHLEPLVADAISAARRDVVRSPRRAAAWGHLGMTLHAHGLLSAAREAYQEAERLDASDPAWPYLLGDCEWAVGNADIAVSAFERASARSNDAPMAATRVAEVLFELGQLDRAEEALTSVLRSRPDDPRARLGHGRIALAKGDVTTALEDARAVLRAAGNVSPALRLLAEAQHVAGDTMAARQSLSKVTPGFTWPDQYLDEMNLRQTGGVGIASKSRTLMLAGRPDEALRIHEEYVKRYPSSVEAQVGLGRMFVNIQMPERGEPHLRAALALNPDRLDVRYSLGTSLKNQGRCREAAVEFQTVIDRQPDSSEAHFELARCLDMMGEPDSALSLARRAAQLAPQDLEVRRYLESRRQGKDQAERR
jgi:tetratricopeptide (TPR) repeat protein